MNQSISAKKLGVVPVAVILLVAGTAVAAITLAYMSTSTQQLGVKAAPVQFSAGADAAVTDYVPALTVSTNATSFAATLRGVPEASVTIGDLVRITNVDDRAHDVVLSAPTVSNPLVTAYRVEWLDGATTVATLDLKAANPSATLSMAPGKTLTGRVVVALASGAGTNNVADSIAVTTTVSS